MLDQGDGEELYKRLWLDRGNQRQHASIQTTERYLGTQQDWVQTVNDRLKVWVE